MFDKLRRQIARAIAPEAVRRFDGASGSRRWDRGAHFGSTSTEALQAAPALRSRARYFYNNNAHARSGVEVLTTNLVGSGITPASKAGESDIRTALGTAWMDWQNVADADGRTDLAGLVANMVRAMVTDGESFAQIIPTSRGLRLRVLPAEQIDEAKTVELGNGGYIVAGVEFNAQGERVAYWVLPTKPTDVLTYAPSVRIPASDILHLMAPVGIGQVRGVSWLAPVLLKLAEIDGLEDALLTGFKVAALHCAFLTDLNGQSADPYDGTQSGSTLESGLEPGTMKRLPAGMDIKFNSPLQAQQSVEFLQSQLRALSTGLGVPEFMLTGDVSRANYSSLRASLITFRSLIERLQYSIIIPQVMRPLWERFVTWSVLSGGVTVLDFESNLAEYMRVEFHPPAMPWADPLKDIQATKEAINAGLMSRRQAVSGLGWSIEELDAEIAADREREESLGLAFNAPSASEQNVNTTKK
ncbi:phage portal protein [Hyphomonas sp. ND6WE1B]|uniref:phage portal protein n=1 Tax=Hyphomonas sp. ND6WE1B TaxID=1848191 RepID=UPI0008076311|nr:phage portal protein [Hyphomonas sp. ND6WE1B]